MHIKHAWKTGLCLLMAFICDSVLAGGDGLLGTYYNQEGVPRAYFTGQTFERVDPMLTMNFSRDPIPGFDDRHYSAVWTGDLEVPHTDSYRFLTINSDGVRVYINGQLVIDRMIDGYRATFSNPINLAKGRYPIRIEYYNFRGFGRMYLAWFSQSVGFRYITEEYLHSNKAIEVQSVEQPCGEYNALVVRYNKPYDSSTARDPDNYTISPDVRISRIEEVDSHHVKLFFSEALEINNTYQITVENVSDLADEPTTIPPTQFILSVDEAEVAPGFLGTYFDQNGGVPGDYFEGESVERFDDQITFDWWRASPHPDIPNSDHFSAVWETDITPPRDGYYRFYSFADDGMRLTLDGAVILNTLDRYRPYWVGTYYMYLRANRTYHLKTEYVERAGHARAHLQWYGYRFMSTRPLAPPYVQSCRKLEGTKVAAFRVVHDTRGINCEAEPVQIQAVDRDGALVQDYEGQISLSTNPARGDWLGGSGLTPGATDSGQANYQYSLSDLGTAALQLQNRHPGLLNINVSGDGKSEDVTFDQSILFDESGFRFVNGGNTSIPAQISAKTTNDISLQAIQTNQETGACEGMFTGSQTVEMAFSCEAPGVCQLPIAINGQSITGANNSTPTNYQTVTANFDAGSTANLTVNYPDAGQIQLYAQKSLGVGSSGSVESNSINTLMTGASMPFIVKPDGFCIEATTANASCVSQNANCSAFVTAGSPFSMRVLAKQYASDNDSNFCDNATTPNFAGDVQIGHTLLAPQSGVPGEIVTQQVSIAAGSVDNISQSFNEVGVIDLTARADNYMGETIPEKVASRAIGRFIPERFDVSATTHATACSGFNYAGFDDASGALTKVGQPFTLSTTVRALAADGDVTQNYQADFAKLNESDVSVEPYVDSSQTQDTFGRFNWAPIPIDFTAGVAEVMDLQAYFASTLLRDSLMFYPVFEATDSDGVTGESSNQLPVDYRHGRSWLDHAQGSELEPLQAPLAVQYFDGTQYVRNTQDACTTYASNQLIVLGDFTDNLQSGESMLQTPSPSAVVVNGEATIPVQFSAPGIGNHGSMRIEWQAPVWLHDDFYNQNQLSTSQSTLNFGEQRSSNWIIYWNEQ